MMDLGVFSAFHVIPGVGIHVLKDGAASDLGWGAVLVPGIAQTCSLFMGAIGLHLDFAIGAKLLPIAGSAFENDVGHVLYFHFATDCACWSVSVWCLGSWSRC